MAKSIFDLDRELSALRRRAGGQSARPKQSLPPPPRPATLVPNGATAQSWRGGRGRYPTSPRRYGRALEALEYAVPEPMPAIAQPNPATCWAAGFAMLLGWKQRNAAITFDQAAAVAGLRWQQKTQSPSIEVQGLGADEAADFCADTGLVMLPMNPSIDGMANLLRQYGPLMIVLRLSGHTGKWTHVRVITGIRGDGTPDGTRLTLIDPSGPQVIERSFRDHVREYEDAARLFPIGTNITLPIFHWPAGARAQAPQTMSRPRAFEAVNARIQGLVPPLRQPSGMTCWATVFTMMVSWRNNQSMSIPDALSSVGQAWVDKFNNNEGLSSTDKVQFLQQAGLVAVPPMNPSIEGWAGLIRDFGPIWVTTDEGSGPSGWAIHARIVTGIHGDGSAGGTMLDIVDPGDGSAYTESFATFIPKFEREAATPGMPLRFQVVHWAAGAGALSFYGGRRPTRAFSALARSPREALVQALVQGGLSPSDAEELIAAYDAWLAQARSSAASWPLKPRAFRAPGPGVTLDQIRRFAAHARDEVIGPIEPILNEALVAADISTPLRIAHFFAQIANETGGFRALVEDLHYSAKRLREVWPGKFSSDEIAERYAGAGPEAIANKAYAGIIGNGPEASGDGWRFRGRGFMQLTGRDNYRRFGEAVGINLVDNPDLAADPVEGFRLATAFWRAAKCNDAADRDDLETVTKKVNGGLIGLEHRRQWLARAKDVWVNAVAAE